MAFVRSKQVDGRTYYQLVKNERVDGKHRQRVLMHLGEHATVEAAIEAWEKRARMDRWFADHARKKGRGEKSRAAALDARAEAWEEKVDQLKLHCGD